MEQTLLINQLLAQWRMETCEKYDDLYTRMSLDKETRWVNDLLTQTPWEAETRQDHCDLCDTPLEVPRRIGHHPAGRKHCYKQITVCRECHSLLSDWQYKWDARWWRPNQPENVRMAFFLLGLGDHYELKSLKSSMEFYRMLARKLTLRGSILLRNKGSDVNG